MNNIFGGAEVLTNHICEANCDGNEILSRTTHETDNITNDHSAVKLKTERTYTDVVSSLYLYSHFNSKHIHFGRLIVCLSDSLGLYPLPIDFN